MASDHAAALAMVEAAERRALPLVTFGPPASDVAWLVHLARAGLALREATENAHRPSNHRRAHFECAAARRAYDATLAAAVEGAESE